jgi:16S rRNA (uracil1498-N3)-methyltransferase
VLPAVLDAAPVTVVIGPEGGLTSAERELLQSHGFEPIALAPHTLRFETAAVAAAAAIVSARLRGHHG